MCDDGSSLLQCIEANPVAMLGHSIVDRFGPKLPFLLKILAAGSPLSIQAHPSIEQAQAGFAAEEAAGIARDAFDRSFKDDNHKPELVCALTPFAALVGFRAVDDTLRFLQAIGAHELGTMLREQGTTGVLQALLQPESMGLDALDVAEIVLRLEEGAAGYVGNDWTGECSLIARLAQKYAGDPGIGVAALLNFVVLQPGQAMYLGAGNLHAYVSGLAVEIMANSDNVLRGGLTPKHIDVAHLLDVVLPDEFEPEPVPITPEGRYLTPAPEFELRRLDAHSTVEVTGPCIVLNTAGMVTLTQGEQHVALQPTQACWVAADERVSVSVGNDVAWLATVGPEAPLDRPA